MIRLLAHSEYYNISCLFRSMYQEIRTFIWHTLKRTHITPVSIFRVRIYGCSEAAWLDPWEETIVSRDISSNLASSTSVVVVINPVNQMILDVLCVSDMWSEVFLLHNLQGKNRVLLWTSIIRLQIT